MTRKIMTGLNNGNIVIDSIHFITTQRSCSQNGPSNYSICTSAIQIRLFKFDVFYKITLLSRTLDEL